MRSNVSELLEKINRLAAKPDFPHLSLIEKDLLKHYLREMYEGIDSERNATAPQEEQTLAAPTKETVETIQPERLLLEKPFSKKQADTPENNSSPKQEPSVAEAVAKVEEVIVKVSPAPDTLSVKATINDGIKPKTTLNELIKDSGKEMHQAFSSKPIRELIDFNKRYAIVNELFGRDVDAFANAVHTIDTTESYDAAWSFVQKDLAVKYSWDETSQSARLFYKLVKQRFGVNEK